MTSMTQLTQQLEQRTTALQQRLPQPKDERLRPFYDVLEQVRRSQLPSFRPLLPLLFRLKGKPYRLEDYFPFEPFFRTRMPTMMLLKTGRQVSKSTTLCVQSILWSAALPFFSTLHIAPFFETIRRFSHQYVRAFLEQSPFCSQLVDPSMNNVLQRSLRNGSVLYFSYAFLDAERTRGYPTDKNVIDETQDINYSLVPIIHETLSGSPYAIRQYAGTPKSFDNTMEALWQDSSQAEWLIRCDQGGCGHWNIPSLQYDLLDMIGPVRDDISDASPGVVCAKCRKPLNPRRGRWYHAFPERRWSFAGYHVPQIIMPIHYANPEKWSILVGKMRGRGNMSWPVFLNEVCGESFDAGSRLVTVTDLKKAACLPWPNRWREAVAHCGDYVSRLVAVDWGGGGGRLPGSEGESSRRTRLRTSYTVVAVLGRHPTGRTDVLWAHRSLRTHEWEWEAQLVLDTINRFQCSHLVYDYSGAGSAQMALIQQSGIPADRLIPIRYHGAASKSLMVYHPPRPDHQRAWFSLDRSRSLAMTCAAIRLGLLCFFQYDWKSTEDPGLLHDFLALLEEKVTSLRETDVYYITSAPNTSDDFAQAVNIGACALWYLHRDWPDLAAAARFSAPAEVVARMNPAQRVDWDHLP